MMTQIDRKPLILFVLLMALALGLSACGRKNDPMYPSGATYPEEYPTE
ncbi:MAG: hypothetical protein HN644_12610 [Rhodospirillales bacterium]|nr:hypothetical protein [Rhodospirillales bacterium]MBT4039022.1 hypothetical protein [Rhodospirillales bacterium]MBT4628052.1 hypothetical protein [Rhodospirillales bacterium]MBT5352572.1 hypothetical protein [Rhodospirillales bacterium]MBT5520898.1 hypothetical protein [Rhodospirillales bacterium]